MITPVCPASRPKRDAGHKAADQPGATASPDDPATAWALAARAGDPDAVDRFVRALHPDVVRYITYLSSDRQLTDDLTQDTFLRALGSLHRFEGRSSARTWLLAIARRTVVDSWRYAATRPRVADTDDWTMWAERAQPSGLPGFDDGVALLDLLNALPPERREACVLTQLTGLPYEEAAEASGCPIGTIRSRVARARATLVELLVEAEEPHVPAVVVV
ncbi:MULTISPECIES: sigma-70 family RNA polymerase sigma factor [Streptomyces]|uniref:sigma-70 family RNA polymerase sigma factor n=1 Tax=Streptomyces TaxID=1883 RepID=UPI001163EECB|nr:MULTISPECIES: sigma-70 family RNA polymerase sigma factor [Streptomyces]MCX4615361.1 sigma-70 family RNA polymerase sigma factor [Streptomyces mirabilis]MCX5356691.1 sigma-70 family RNA polymerase sigma factor [Streptomyces mirabilis]QDN84801.1 sigma-70 family RNA polymerase sigma factor [Streptomyces sp. RLB3-6]QDO05669.1 sigma-70 family RNA polymerase sigma factor [Streptomyces sp. S1D4-23]